MPASGTFFALFAQDVVAGKFFGEARPDKLLDMGVNLRDRILPPLVLVRLALVADRKQLAEAVDDFGAGEARQLDRQAFDLAAALRR